jgi:hypothetical protein
VIDSGPALAALIVIATALAIVAVELTARAILRRRGYYVWPPYYRRRYALDRETHPQLEPVIWFLVNSQGERGSEYRPDAGVYRVVVAGGSAAECGLNDQTTQWAAQLERMLNEPRYLEVLGARRVHVGNIARSGLDARALDWVFEHVLGRYDRIDLLVLMAGQGDLLKWIESGLDAHRPPVPIEAAFSVYPTDYTWSPARSATVALLKLALRRFLRRVDTRENAARWIGRARELRRNAKEIRTEMPDATEALAVFEHYLRRALSRATHAAEKVVIVQQPYFRKARFTPDEEALFWNGGLGRAFEGDAITEYLSNEVLFGIVRQFEASIAKVAAEFGIPFIEVMSGLNMDTATFYDHFHLTPAGCGVLARNLADAITQVPAPSPPQS